MKFYKPLVAALTLIAMNSCSPTLPNSGGGTGGGNSTPEATLCTTSNSYTSPVTITGTAVFYKRGLILTKNGGGVVTDAKLGAPTSASLPIRYAEIQVTNSNGAIVQCGTTDNSGNLKGLDGSSALTIPNTPGNYTIKVMSRAHRTMSVPGGKTPFAYLASIKKDIYSNEVYNLSSTVTSSGSGSFTTSLVAYARESQSTEVLGGAFNIYNDILVAYEYLAQNTGTSNVTCMSTKLDVYWKAGFNPAQYLYPSADPSTLGTVSFYVRGQNQLFINGGVQGDVATSDTDHFDDTVIVHELGHHVEDVCGKMDSPGGTHYGLYRIDPRFAWSEGWGNFFGAHMMGNNVSTINPDLTAQLSAPGWSHYLDTNGYVDGSVTSGSSMIILNLTKPGNNPESVGGGRYYDKVDAATYPGEGHTREVSISRSLFKGTNTCTTYCTNTNNFQYYWKAFENDPAGLGMGKTNYAFRNSVRFYNRLNAVAPGANMTAIDSVLNSDEAQQRDTSSAYVSGGYQNWAPYAVKLINNGTTQCTNPMKIQPRQEVSTVTDGFSDQRYSNHYYVVDMSILPGVTSITLTATKSAGTDTDIDLILYKDGFRFNQDCTTDSNGNCSTYGKDLSSADMVLKDRSTGSPLGTTFTKSISSMGSLSPSTFYMLDVRAYTANKTIDPTTAYTYTLTTQSGAYLCPSPTY